MKNALLIASAIAALAVTSSARPTDTASQQAAASAHFWTGVWQLKAPDKPGVVITLADDTGSLTGTIVFDVYKRQTNEHLATEPRTILNPHLQGNALDFQVRRILKPHLKGDPPAYQDPSDTDIAEMTLVPISESKATLTCPKCGNAAPTELIKEQ